MAWQVRTPPSISEYRLGNTGIPWARRLESGRPGPRVMITALIHGNEPCGAETLCFLLRTGFRPVMGEVLLVFANVAAFARYTPSWPLKARFVDEDMNRIWDENLLDGPEQSVERERARRLRPLLAGLDYLLDLHSMLHEAPPLILAGRHRKATALAQRLGLPGMLVLDGGHSAGKRLRDYGPFDDADAAPVALLAECGQHWAEAAAAVARETALRFLDGLGLMAADYRAEHLPYESAPGTNCAVLPVVQVTETVTVESPHFAFTRPFRGLETIAAAGTVIAHDGERVVATPYDDCLLIMPAEKPAPGQTAVRLGRHLGCP
ncbi:MAG TPA: succinylglutamate desuccinylase/aspartoacylase family protein [Stellaceae bacterium]|jgi:predicted deacylase|nr:succinylglutamate desuccinylase/aspartoacylase family protein [Stellaceae bacterium]